MKRISNKIFNRRLLAFSLCLAVITSLVASSLSLLVPISPTTAQTNPQTTDIFTGQFIPAYFGAAYDPSEAYKQMAGLEVIVFGYDTWGTVVNNFAYRTQIKANGSFQAAGLPNASHYGICLNVNEKDVTANTIFRAPLPDDNLQAAFAYSQANFTKPTGNINTQTGKPAVMFPFHGEEESCRVFVTSNRTADIANHINVFPLVPTTVLSVIIQDSLTSSVDLANLNAPYEIYAQRVVIRNGDTDTSSDVSTDPAQLQQENSEKNSVSSSPIIRGRSIRFASPNGGTGSIFQAYAPKGHYAITYWRPESKSSSNMSYINYDGTNSLETLQHGLAFEEVKGARLSYTGTALGKPATETTTNAWGYLSSRKLDDDALGNAWKASYGSTNAWGLVTRSNNNVVRPQAAVSVSVEGGEVGFMDIGSRKCTDGGQTANTNLAGIWAVSSLCLGSGRQNVIQADSNTPISITINPGTHGQFAYQELFAAKIEVGGRTGPARRDLSAMSVPQNSVEGTALRNGRVFPFAQIDLKVLGKTFKNAAQADSNGKFYIASKYFKNNPYAQYVVSIHPPYNAPVYEKSYIYSYSLDTQTVLAALKGDSANMGNLAVLPKPANSLETVLASLNFNTLLSKVRIPSAYAQSASQEAIGCAEMDGETAGTVSCYVSGEDNTVWRIPISLQALGGTANFFTLNNYNLKTIEINPPQFATEGEDSVWNKKEYELLDRPKEGTAAEKGVWLDNDGDQNSQIQGLRLRVKNVDHPFMQLFNDQGISSAIFDLRVRFEAKGDRTNAPVATTTTTGEGEAAIDSDNSVGQSGATSIPTVLEATWPIEIRYSGNLNPGQEGVDTGDLKDFTLTYEPIVLEIASQNCGGGSLFRNGFTSVIKNATCSIVLGAINLVKGAINQIAYNFITYDPLNQYGSGVITKFWNVSRNIINSLAVLILIVAGVAIMLRYDPKTFNIQSVLTKLIIAIVAVNFSILIVQIAVDVSNLISFSSYNLLSQSFLTNGEGLASGRAAGGALAAWAVALVAVAIASGFSAGWAILLGALAVLVLLAYCLFKIVVQYFFRLVVIWICIIGAPFAFASRILPGTSSYFTKWRKALVGALVAQTALALMLALSFGILSDVTTIESSMLGTMIQLFMAFAILYMSTVIPAKAAAVVGADVASGLQSMSMKGLATAKGRMAMSAGNMVRRKAEREARDAANEGNTEYQNANWIGKRTFRARDYVQRTKADGLVMGRLGLGAEERHKIEEEGTAKVSKFMEMRKQREFYSQNPDIHHNELVDRMNEQRMKIQQEQDVRVAQVGSEANLNLRQYERQQKLANAVNTQTIQNDTSGYERGIDAIRQSAGLPSIQDGKREQDRADAAAKTQIAVQKDSVRVDRPDIEDFKRMQDVNQSEATALGQLAATEAVRDTVGLATYQVKKKREAPVEAVVKESLRFTANTAAAEGSPTLTVLRVTDGTRSMTRGDGSAILRGDEAIVRKAVEERMLRNNKALPQPQKDALVTMIKKEIDDAGELKTVDSVLQYSQAVKPERVDEILTGFGMSPTVLNEMSVEEKKEAYVTTLINSFVADAGNEAQIEWSRMKAQANKPTPPASSTSTTPPASAAPASGSAPSGGAAGSAGAGGSGSTGGTGTGTGTGTGSS